MTEVNAMLPRARIPYGTWGSSYFPAWQTSALAEVNIGQFAGEAMNRILGLRGVPKSELDYLVIGSTVPWHWKFWTAPMVASCMGQRLPGFHIEQACATGLQAVLLAGAQVEAGRDVVGVCTFDRTSDSPVGVFPERRAHERTQAIADVWDNFGFDPATGKAMIAAAGMTARKYRCEKSETDDCAFQRYEQYFQAKNSGFLDRVLVPLDILNVQGRPLGRVDGDYGVRQLTRATLAAQRELDTCVTGGTQTHASDGMATLLVTTEVRTHPSLMPEAPAFAVQKVLEMANLKLDDIAVFKNHNPFAVNDVVFTKVTGYPWSKLNNTGCPLVWGHPQGPTLTRVLIEALEEAVDLGGGYVLVFGCAAGDVGIAAVLKVS